MIKIYFKDRLISLSKEKTESHSSDIETLRISEAERLKLRINSFIDKPAIKELNIYGDYPEKIEEKIKSEMSVINASGGLVKGKSGKKLFIFRNGKWDLPKGKAEAGELPDECALREVSEECSLKKDNLVITGFLRKTFHLYKLKGDIVLKQTFWYDMDYLGEESCAEPQIEEGIERCFWAEDIEIPELMKNTYGAIGDLVCGLGG